MAPHADTDPASSALTDFIQSNSPAQNAYSSHLAAQVHHDLQYQHEWKSLEIHKTSPTSGMTLPRPLISGVPPHRVYVHPDEQVEMLRQKVDEKNVSVEREWVLPTHLKECWSLRKFAEITDAVENFPVEPDTTSNGNKAASKIERKRGPKRVLVATVGDDSTIVYYILHDGIVKPRQN